MTPLKKTAYIHMTLEMKYATGGTTLRRFFFLKIKSKCGDSFILGNAIFYHTAR